MIKVQNFKTNLNKNLKDIFLLTPDIFFDERGFFYESWNENKLNKILNKKITFVQDNHSKSKKGVLRGMHYQLPPAEQGKLVRCTMGKIYDVAIDLRKYSSTFGQWIGVILSDENKSILWIPSGFAHGFLTLSAEAEVQYKVTSLWNKNFERSIRWDDPQININWPFKNFGIEKPDLSLKDNEAILLKEAEISQNLF